jgi:uncharacterized protein YqgV (UPF0045/DUF77 family)
MPCLRPLLAWRCGCLGREWRESLIRITAQVSPYPLGQEAFAPGIGEALQIFRECALEVEPDAVSTLLVGDDTTIFGALQRAFCHAAEQGQVVMVVTLSNGFPGAGQVTRTRRRNR